MRCLRVSVPVTIDLVSLNIPIPHLPNKTVYELFVMSFRIGIC
jgi:hypothetical protein